MFLDYICLLLWVVKSIKYFVTLFRLKYILYSSSYLHEYKNDLYVIQSSYKVLNLE